MMNKVTILKEGYSYVDKDSGQFKADCTITLIQGGGVNVVVDTGLPCDKDCLLRALGDHSITPLDVAYVVGTHGHSDHIGNLNIFGPHATFIVSYDICQGDTYIDNKLKEGVLYPLMKNVDVLATPGHTGADVSVIVHNTHKGTIVVAGDLFEKEEDLNDSSIWEEQSENIDLQRRNREKILHLANWIVPGHGPAFCVNNSTS